MNTRIYKVTVPGETKFNYLVEATSQTQAILYVARGMMAAAIAKPKEIAALMATGTPLESAGEAE